jgi:hypothetical protein
MPEAPSPGISILTTEHDRFPEVAALNPDFRAEAGKMKVVLDVDPELAACLLQHKKPLVERVLALCRTLKQHRCGGGGDQVAPLDVDALGEIAGRRRSDDAVDVAHLLEHMVIDLVVEISGTPRSTGVTCALRHPENRFHVFVECEDPSVGSLAANVAAEALSRFLRNGDDPERYRRQVLLARWLVGRNGNLATAGEAAGALGWSRAEAKQAVIDLLTRGFLRRQNPPLNFSGLSYFSRS